MKRSVLGVLLLSGSMFTLTFSSSCGGSGGGDSAGPNKIFVTSTMGMGDLGSWTDAGGNTGLAAADAICQARADAAGHTGDFAAWMSDSSDDAYCRVHGLSGKVSGNCGQAVLPADAGPWIRTDGYPFSGNIVDLVNHVIYTPNRYDEFGSRIPANTFYYTGTRFDGTLNTAGSKNCSGWTGTSGSLGTTGSSENTTFWWTSSNGMPCDFSGRLLCMQTGAGEPLPALADTGRRVFLSSIETTGDLEATLLDQTGQAGITGLDAGDALCRYMADTAGFADTANYKAWLSDSATDAADRLTSDGPWVRLDGIPVADSKMDLLDGTLFTSIAVQETLEYDTAHRVWTGTLTSGLKAAQTCSDWTDEASAGMFGNAVSADGNWTDINTIGGDRSYRLYCFED